MEVAESEVQPPQDRTFLPLQEIGPLPETEVDMVLVIALVPVRY